ncbi:MAG: VOC family protein [Bacteroidales bacterium]|nr:VOC family protein [Bacteroidales bacterium]
MNISSLGTVHHIGVVTYDIQKTANFYTSIGYKEVVGGYDPCQNVYGYFFEKEGCPTIELLAPYNEQSPINKILSKNGVTPYHLCYEVEGGLEDAIAELRKNNFILISRPTVSENLSRKKVCFLFHKDVGIVELLGL